jgi:hypothetical protein
MKFNNILSGLVSHLFFLHGNPASKRLLRKVRNFSGKHTFVDRGRSSPNLLLILAGYKKELWPYTLTRIAKSVPESMDVCLVVPGADVSELGAIAEQHGWSLLHTRANKLSLAQNLAITHHPQARWIYKLDEDIFVGKDYFQGLNECWKQAEEEGRFDIGIVAPLLNVNGYSSRILLEETGKTKQFEDLFGTAKQACFDTPFWRDPRAAEFLWDLCKPFDQVADRFFQGKRVYSACPFRFSIGAFMMQRTFWDSMQGFSVARHAELGSDEVDLCAVCHNESKAIIVCHYVLAGHFGFGPQNQHMFGLLPTRNDLSWSE